LSIIFLPVIQLAKLASAFMLLVFALVHLSVIVFRESDNEWYQPEFISPFYPYIQFLGVLSSVVLIGFMGWLTILGSAGLVVVGTLWHLVYVRNRADRLGAIFQSLSASDEDMEFFEKVLEYQKESSDSVIVPFFDLKELDPLHVEKRLRLAASLCRRNDRLDVIHFHEVPEQSLLSEHDMSDDELKMIEERKRLLTDEVQNNIQVDQVITHNSRRALLNYVQGETPQWIVFDWKEPSPWQILIGIRRWWLENLPCDALFFQDNDTADFQKIAVVVEPGPYDGEVVKAARSIADFFESNLTFLNSVDTSDEGQVEYIESYQQKLLDLADESAEAEIIPQRKWDETLIERSAELDLVLFGGRKLERLFDMDALVRSSTRNELACSYARIRSNLKYPRSILQEDEGEEVDVLELLKASGSVMRINPSDKNELFGMIAESLDDETVKESDVEEALWQREEIQNTYIEEGIAFPHGVLDSMRATKIRLVLLEEPVSYTPNEDGVTHCIVTLGPSEERDTHLQILRTLSSVFVNPEVRDELSRAETEEDVVDLLSDHL
ncbi:MAG: PTS sugar transporter subunit IIA, partial [bacterium]